MNDDRLARKIDFFLLNWKKNPSRKPLIIKGARQIGKTRAVEFFAKNNYKNFIEINFVEQSQFKAIFDDGFEVDSVIRAMSLINPSLKFLPGETLIFFDELQDCPNCATSLKFFHQDGRFDVICSGSLMGINYKTIESNSVGNKEDYEMSSLDFEEFLWAKGYTSAQIENLFSHMLSLEPFSELELKVMFDAFHEYMILGGMPEIVFSFIKNRTFEGTLELQRQILRDYEEDITKYATGVDKSRIMNAYKKIPVFLGNENKKFRISKIDENARSREYLGAIDWLETAGIVNISYCMESPSLPLRGNFNPDNYRVYFRDTGLLVGSLDDEVQSDLRANKNFGTYKGALYENLAADMLKKAGYDLFFYKNEKSTIELDFIVRDRESLVPLEIKATDGSSVSLKHAIKNTNTFSDIKYGIKFAEKNLGFNGEFYTFPFFLIFLLKRYLKEK
ncbi:ATP-binding protein [Candidatus Saccharibacteria bacterium]|nr:ATP-binding protein [Candidatus Saccharibacteria bacterium]